MNPYNKYSVAPIARRTLDNIVFDSRMEMRRYKELKLLVKAKKIRNLQIQPHFLLQPAFEKHGFTFKAIYYVADFSYYDLRTKKEVVEDVKGAETKEFKLKRKMFHFHHNMELRLITSDMLSDF